MDFVIQLSPNPIRVLFFKKVLLLRFFSSVPFQSPSGKRPRTNLRQTKDEPKNSESGKVLFVKIAVSFPSLIPCLIPPTDERETTDRTPTQLPAHKKCCFLRLLPNKVILIPKKVDFIPKKVDSSPEIVAYPPNKKIAQKSDFSCTSQKKSVSLHPNIKKH